RRVADGVDDRDVATRPETGIATRLDSGLAGSLDTGVATRLRSHDAGVATDITAGVATGLVLGVAIDLAGVARSVTARVATGLVHEAIFADPFLSRAGSPRAKVDARRGAVDERTPLERQAACAVLVPRTRTIAARRPSSIWSTSLVETVSE